MLNNLFNEVADTLTRHGGTPLSSAVEMMFNQRKAREEQRRKTLVGRAQMLSTIFTAAVVETGKIDPTFADQKYAATLTVPFCGAVVEASKIVFGYRDLATMFDFMEFISEKYGPKKILDIFWYFYQVRLLPMVEQKADDKAVRHYLFDNPWQQDQNTPDFVKEAMLDWCVQDLKSMGVEVQISNDLAPTPIQPALQEETPASILAAAAAAGEALGAMYGSQAAVDTKPSDDQEAIAAAASLGASIEVERTTVSVSTTEVNLPQAVAEVTGAQANVKPA